MKRISSFLPYRHKTPSLLPASTTSLRVCRRLLLPLRSSGLNSLSEVHSIRYRPDLDGLPSDEDDNALKIHAETERVDHTEKPFGAPTTPKSPPTLSRTPAYAASSAMLVDEDEQSSTEDEMSIFDEEDLYADPPGPDVIIERVVSSPTPEPMDVDPVLARYASPSRCTFLLVVLNAIVLIKSRAGSAM